MTTADLGSIPDYVSWFVNRSKQHGRYREMLAGKTPMAVMLIEAPTGMGKSFLVKKMGYLANQAGHPLVVVDFRERRTHDTLWLVRHARDQLGRAAPPDLFNELTRTINKYTASADRAVVPIRPRVAVLLLKTDEGPPREVEIDLVEVRRLLNRFNESDVRTLVFDLGLKFDDLTGENLAAKIVDLIAACERYQLLDQLVLWGARELSQVPWWRDAPADPDFLLAGGDKNRGDAGLGEEGGIVADRWGELRMSSAQARQLALDQINRAFFACFRNLVAEFRPVFLFDSFEDATDEAEEWIRDNLLYPLYDSRLNNFLVIIAGRQTPDAGDRKPLVGKTGLDPFTIEHVREYLLEKRRIKEDDIEKIYAYCRGFPGILATMADAYTSTFAEDDDW